ncbi:mannitol dehydrogenase family protein [Celerinatantimonas diazotrophica]|uniref:Fructuronate reductase n=1 Tax=Celerinatantimonas diazotrophica TaxID=412034 RepID=A0A4R1K4J6_9GAMM|nr:fructuronate reductase [Celerinatantimonas diazotrophica]TCK59042.1 fructuronate reductase [Celerinatantimonas diazotrophica]CAG9297677.1 Polyol:NADP oxidoreductase [Celerinatantimonas diazotrophica]
MQQTIANATLPDAVKRPSFDRSQLKPKWVHLGFGAFHRAHQGLFMSDLANQQHTDWGLCEISLIGGEEQIKKLRAQEHCYTVVEKGAHETQVRISGSVCESLHPALDGIETILNKLANPEVAIVSMTITEKGYCADASGHLDQQNPSIAHDLATPEQPKSAIGYIVQALKMRKDAGVKPFTVLSCDNIQGNGEVVAQVVLDYAKVLDGELATWIEKNVTFPCTMVDRIVPAMTTDSYQQVTELLGGVTDPCSIVCEPFRQWVVEDRFVAGRPEWEKVGAQLVEDVVPFEEMKLRMLNGSHSFLAYLGYLGGYETIAQSVANDDYRQAAKALMLKEQVPTLSVQGVDLNAYADSLLERFANPNLHHRTWQIAMDGSQKLPQRMLKSVQFHLAKGQDFSCLALAIAGWMRYVSGVDEKDQPIEVADPMAAELRAICDKAGLNVAVVSRLLGVEAIFPKELAANKTFISAIELAYQSVLELGAKGAVAQLVKSL